MFSRNVVYSVLKCKIQLKKEEFHGTIVIDFNRFYQEVKAMHIAICDDDSKELSRISALLNTYRQEKNIRLTFKTYQNATELISTMKSCQYNLLLMDILTPDFAGIQTAREILCKKNSNKSAKNSCLNLVIK